jgi:zinc protease
MMNLCAAFLANPSSLLPGAAGRFLARAARALLLALAGLAWVSPASAVLPIEHWTTSTGARVYFVRAPAIPMLDISITFDAGDRHDPPGKAGLAALTLSMLAKGIPGADETRVAERFAEVGAVFGQSVSDDSATVSLRSLTSEPELARALTTFTEVLARPTFPGSVLGRESERWAQALRESLTRPGSIVSREYSRLLYPQHPYGVSPSPESVAAIARDDLLTWHRAHLGADGAVVAMIGAITRAQAEGIAEQVTAGLPPGAAKAVMPRVERLTAPLERYIAHPATQSHIRIGAPAVAWGDPDRYALTVGNYVLGGGGFVSRLYDRVREKRGLAYSVHSGFSQKLQPGPFTISLQTGRDQTALALRVVRDTLEEFLRDGPTDAEVEAAKANLIGGFALRIDSNAKILGYLASIGYYKLPLDHLERWTAEIARVDARQIREAFARHVRADALATVVVGGAP